MFWVFLSLQKIKFIFFELLQAWKKINFVFFQNVFYLRYSHYSELVARVKPSAHVMALPWSFHTPLLPRHFDYITPPSLSILSTKRVGAYGPNHRPDAQVCYEAVEYPRQMAKCFGNFFLKILSISYTYWNSFVAWKWRETHWM